MSSAHAMNYYKFMYKIEPGDTFSYILKKFVKDLSIINAKTPLVSKIKANNPQIKNWYNLPPNTVIELYISPDFMDFEKYRPYAANTLKKIAEEEKSKKGQSYPAGLKGSIFYMGSLGTFTQKSSDTEVNFKQNSPLSLGTSFTYYPKDKLYSYSASLYASYILASANSLTSDKVSIPPEIGGNLYGEYRFLKNNITLYAGPDYESFSTFNLNALQTVNKVYVDRVGATYFTLGIAKSISVFNKQFFTKLSASRSLVTFYQNNAPQSSIDSTLPSDAGTYSGYRFLFYLNYKLNDKIYLHSLLKYHTMTGPSQLSTTRIGLGFGYILF